MLENEKFLMCGLSSWMVELSVIREGEVIRDVLAADGKVEWEAVSGRGLEPPKGNQWRLAPGRLCAVPLLTDSKQMMEGHSGESPCALTAPRVCWLPLGGITSAVSRSK